MVQHRRPSRTRLPLVLLTVLTLLFTLFPSIPVPDKAAASSADLTLSQSILSVGYPTVTLTITSSNLFPLRNDTQLTLYDTQGRRYSQSIADVKVIDKNRLTFTLQPGLQQGDYKILVASYTNQTVGLSILTGYDPTNVIITPGSDLDIRLDWQDPNAKDISNIVIQYGPIDQPYYPYTATASLGDKHIILRNQLEHGKAYKIKIYTQKADLSTTLGVEYTNNGLGYKVADTTPPKDLTDLRVTSVQNGFQLNWTDPADPDLDLITVQYAEHGTTNWQGNAVVSKGVQTVEFRQMNTAKRYDFRFIKTDKYGNWSYQIDTHDGYGYTFDTAPPARVTGLSASAQSDSSAQITWTDPSTEDFHHANVYLRQENSSKWVSIGRADKGAQSFKAAGLAANIRYETKVTAVDNFGNESEPLTTRFTVKTTDLSYLTSPSVLKIAQEAQGGLELKWETDAVSSVDYSLFKVYYARIGEEGNMDNFYMVPLTNKTNKSAILRDLASGTYALQLRLFDSHGIEQVIGSTFTNGGHGYYVSGNNSHLPRELAEVRILAHEGRTLLVTWNAASTDGTHVEVSYAQRSSSPDWQLAGRVDKRDQRLLLPDLSTDRNYFLRLVVVDQNRNDRQSLGVIYDNSGYGYNVLGGDTYPPREVQDASAAVSLNTVAITYTEPSDPDFDNVNIYVYKTGTTGSIQKVNVSRGSGGANLRDLIAGATYSFRITTVDTYGNESSGITLDNDGQGYLIQESGLSLNEVRNGLLIPQGDKLTVRFQDPLNADYTRAVIYLKKRGEASSTRSETAHKGTNEVTFYNLENNQQYLVRIVTYGKDNKPSNGVLLGGDNGISLHPIPQPSNAKVTLGDNRLTVTWDEPANKTYTSVRAEVKTLNGPSWFEPLHVQPGTNKAVFHGLSNELTYTVRLTAVVNDTGSAAVDLTRSGQGYRPSEAGLYASPFQIERAASGTRTVTIHGTNTGFTWSNQTTVKLYNRKGIDVSYRIENIGNISSDKMEVRIDRTLEAGRYQLAVTTPNSGELRTWIEVTDHAPTLTLDGANITTAVHGNTQIAVTLNGTGFTTSTMVRIDENSEVKPSYQSSGQLRVTLPAGLLPGTHKITVNNGDTVSKPIAFTVYPFESALSLNTPNSRTGSYRSELTVQNRDSYSRDARIFVLIRRNGLIVETKEYTEKIGGYQSKSITLDFGGNNTPYADGPTHNISIQAYVVDTYSQTPLTDPIVLSKELNL